MDGPHARVRARRMQPDERRRLIMSAARELALEQGLDAISRRTLAARLDVAAALIGPYTTSMADLVAETFSAISTQELHEVTEIADSQPTPAHALTAVLRTMLGGERDGVTAIWTDGWSLGRRSAPSRALCTSRCRHGSAYSQESCFGGAQRASSSAPTPQRSPARPSA